MANRPIVLSIAGYDPSSGAGVTADVKTAAAMGCYAVTCITALTVQSTQGVFGLDPVRPEVVRDTIAKLAEDLEITAVRVGMLGSARVAETVAECIQEFALRNVVLDPVLKSSSGAELIDGEGIEVIRRRLLPLCTVITPNTEEAVALASMDRQNGFSGGSTDEIRNRHRKLAEKLHRLGANAVVITGGDLPKLSDYLSFYQDGALEQQVFESARIESCATHGTGCAFATALACGLAHGKELPAAVREAKDFVRKAIARAYPVGKGCGPLNHLFWLE